MANYFELLGMRPIAGRTFLAGEEERAQAAVVTSAFWISRPQQDPAAVGRVITLDGRHHRRIVETLPVSDAGPVEAFLPLPYALSGQNCGSAA